MRRDDKGGNAWTMETGKEIMKFPTTLKILLKSQLASMLLFLIILAISGVGIGEVLEGAIFLGAYFLAFSAMAYYTIGIIFHRLFLCFDLTHIIHTLTLAVLLAGIFAVYSGTEQVGSFVSALILILPQMLIIRYFTLKELRKSA